MLNILVVEDEFEGMKYCCMLIKSIVKDGNVFMAGSGREAMRILEKQDIDVFFIDVKLPDMTGFELTEKIRAVRDYDLAQIVFVTGAHTDQLKVHQKYHHYAYIEKPYTPRIFRASVGRLLISLDSRKKGLPESKRQKKIYIETDREVTFVNFDDTFFVETEGRLLCLTTRHGKYSGIRMKLDDFIQGVNSEFFLRCNKSYGLNVKNIMSIRLMQRRLYHAFFDEQERIFCPVSATYYDEIMAMFKNKMCE